MTPEKRFTDATLHLGTMAAGDPSTLNRGAIQASAERSGKFQQRVVALYEAHRDGIYRFLVGQGLNPMAAQDVTQDVFVDLFVALEKGVVLTSEQGWLYTVAGRSVADYWRREFHSVPVELDANPGFAANVPSRDLTPETQAGNKQRIERVAAGLRRLPKEHRLCIHLRMQGLRYREIAGILGVSTSTAAEWLASAVSRLRGEVND
jgi:RNA polymerase sigma-70 factor, ECF subfamily